LKKRFIFSYGDTISSQLNEPNERWENISWEPKHEKKVMDYLHSRWAGDKDWLNIIKANQRVSFIDYAQKQGVDLNKPIVGLLTNIIWEAFAEYTCRVFPDMLTWIKKTIDYFSKRQDIQLLIRVHPAECQGNASKQYALDEINKMFPELPSNVFIIKPDENINTYEAMGYCDAAIIYQTQAGLELAAQGIPVLLPGDAYIRNKGIAYESFNEDEYFEQLDQLPFSKRLSEDIVKRARKYAYHAFYRNMIPLSFLEETQDWMLFKSTLKKLDELLPNTDEGLDIICNGLLNGSAYIYPDEKNE
jgi:hypothetical protein